MLLTIAAVVFLEHLTIRRERVFREREDLLENDDQAPDLMFILMPDYVLRNHSFSVLKPDVLSCRPYR